MFNHKHLLLHSRKLKQLTVMVVIGALCLIGNLPTPVAAKEVTVGGIVSAVDLSTVTDFHNPPDTNVQYSNVNEGWNRFNIDAPRGWVRLYPPSERLNPVGSALICTRTTFSAQEKTFDHKYRNPNDIFPCNTYIASNATQDNPTGDPMPFIELVPIGTTSDTVGGQKLPINIPTNSHVTSLTLRATDRFQNVAFFVQVIGMNGESWTTAHAGVESNGGGTPRCQPGGEGTPYNHIISPYNHTQELSQLESSNCFENKTVRFDQSTGMPTSVKKIRVWFLGFNNSGDGHHKGDHVIVAPNGITVTTEDVPKDICGVVQGDDRKYIANWPVQITTNLGAVTVITDSNGKFSYSSQDLIQNYSVALPDNTTPVTAPSGYVGQGVTANGTASYENQVPDSASDCASNCGCSFTYNAIPQCTNFNAYEIQDENQLKLPPIGKIDSSNDIKISQSNVDSIGPPDRERICWSVNDTPNLYTLGRQGWSCLHTCIASKEPNLQSLKGNIQTWRNGAAADLSAATYGIGTDCLVRSTQAQGEVTGKYEKFIETLPDSTDPSNPNALRELARTKGLVFMQTTWNYQDPGDLYCTTNPGFSESGIIWNSGNYLYNTMCGRQLQVTGPLEANCTRRIIPASCDDVALNPPIVDTQEWQFIKETHADGTSSWQPIYLTWRHAKESRFKTEKFHITQILLPYDMLVDASTGTDTGEVDDAGNIIMEYSYALPQDLITRLFTRLSANPGPIVVQISSTTQELCTLDGTGEGSAIADAVYPPPPTSCPDGVSQPPDCDTDPGNVCPDGSPGPICPTMTATVSLTYAKPGECVASTDWPNATPLQATIQVDRANFGIDPFVISTNTRKEISNIPLNHVMPDILKADYGNTDYLCHNYCDTNQVTASTTCRVNRQDTAYDFFVTDVLSAFNGWWQAVGGLAYGATINSPVPGNPSICSNPGCQPILMRSPNYLADTQGGVVLAINLNLPTSVDLISERPNHDYAKQLPATFQQQVLPTAAGSIFTFFKTKLENSPEYQVKNSSEIASFDFAHISSAAQKSYLWEVNGPLNITTAEPIVIPSGYTFIILVQGTVNISSSGTEINNQVVSVENGGLFLIVASGDISIDGSVGQSVNVNNYSSYNSVDAPSSLQGMYLTDGSLIIQASPQLSQPDRRFVGEGTFVGKTSVVLERSFAKPGMTEVDQNNGRWLYAYTPTEIFRHRPDMVLRIPPRLFTSIQEYQEIQ